MIAEGLKVPPLFAILAFEPGNSIKPKISIMVSFPKIGIFRNRFSPACF